MNAEREAVDPTLAALMREHSTETPPAHVDAAIRAAAHRSVASASRHRLASMHDARAPALASMAWRWWTPLAAAAVIGVIAIGVLPLAPSIVEDDAQRASDTPDKFNAPAARDATPSVAAPKVEGQEPSLTDARSSVAAPRVEPQKPAPLGDAPSSVAAPSSITAPKFEPQRLAKQQKRDDLGSNVQPTPKDSEPPRGFVPSPPPAAPLQRVPLPPPAPRAEQQSVTKSPPPAVQPPAENATSRAPATAAVEAPARADAPFSDILRVPPADDALRGQRETRVGSVRGDDGTSQGNSVGRQREAADARETDAPSRSATDWVRHIRELRDAGRIEEALRALRDFRAAFADADSRLPPDLGKWARTRR